MELLTPKTIISVITCFKHLFFLEILILLKKAGFLVYNVLIMQFFQHYIPYLIIYIITCLFLKL